MFRRLGGRTRRTLLVLVSASAGAGSASNGSAEALGVEGSGTYSTMFVAGRSSGGFKIVSLCLRDCGQIGSPFLLLMCLLFLLFGPVSV